MSVRVDDNPMESRYEAWVDGTLVGASQYELTADTIVFFHAVVADEYEGQELPARSRGAPSMTPEPAGCTYARSARTSGLDQTASGVCRSRHAADVGGPSTDSGDSAFRLMHGRRVSRHGCPMTDIPTWAVRMRCLLSATQ